LAFLKMLRNRNKSYSLPGKFFIPSNNITKIKTYSNKQYENPFKESNLTLSSISQSVSNKKEEENISFKNKEGNLNLTEPINIFPNVTIINEENNLFQISDNFNLDSNFEKTKIALNELNHQIIKMNYCNVLQNNSIQRLDLSLSFLSSQINKLKLLNKKRKKELEKTIELLKKNENKTKNSKKK
jgi:hypothetical protein